jgi:phage recombination protein Bet
VNAPVQNALTVRQDFGGTALTMQEDELIDVLQSSLYPGAAMGSIKLVIGYCRAAGLDPMQKPVHIVPMWDKHSKSMRDVVMPGIGLYRTQAARSGALAGIGEPEYGPMVDLTLSGVSLRVPEWCRVVVKRLMPNGAIAEFFAKEYWVENYATAGKDTEAPNTMWKKRSMGQLGKCAEAQALRKAFPEMTGGAPTADEMEGRTFEVAEVDITPKAQTPAQQKVTATLPECTTEKFAENQAAWRALITSGKKTSAALIAMLSTKTTLSEEQKLTIDSWAHENE